MSKSSILKNDARIGIVNRGEAAIRFIRAVRDFNRLAGTKMQTIAFCTDREKDSLFAREADEARAFSVFSDLADGQARPASPYLNRRLMLEALTSSECQALWPGWGFLSEDAAFVAMTEKARLVFLGPSSRAMALLGDKIQAKELAEKNDVPVCPWSGGAVKDLAAAKSFAEKTGYPLIIKAANAGGGRGIRFVLGPDELAAAWKSAVDETLRITGNTVVFIERLVEKGRHMEVQVLADRFGNVKTFGVRDCSVQRKNQKIIEETPPANFDPETAAAMETAARRLIEAADYESAGTVEFLYDVKRKEFYFMEVNTRLQVEHPITEQLYGVDLVHGQLRVARGEDLGLWNPVPRGAVMEARLNAEDPDQDFRPAPGRVARLRIPAGPGVRVDSGIEEGSEISPDFDSMAAKIIASGPDRPSAIARLERALSEMRIKIEGGTTNRSFVLGLLANPEIRAGGVHTRFVEELLASKRGVLERSAWPEALAAAAVEQYRRRYQEDFANFSQQMFTFGSPRDLRPGAGHEVKITALGQPFTFLVRYLGDERYSLSLNGPGAQESFSLRYVRKQEDVYLFAAGTRRHVQMGERGGSLHVEVDGIPYEFETDCGGMIKAPSPALVLSVPLAPGAAVEKGDVLLTLEAMKMEMIVPSPQAGVVREIRVKAGEQVGAGQLLVVLDTGEKTENSGAPPPSTAKISFAGFRSAEKEKHWDALRAEFRAVFAGFDSSPSADGLFSALVGFIEKNPAFAPAFRGLVLESMEFFAATESLFSTNRTDSPESVSQSQELLSHYFKRSVDREKGLPESFLQALLRVFALYAAGKDSSVEDERHLIFHIFRSRAGNALRQRLLLAALSAASRGDVPAGSEERVVSLLDELVFLAQTAMPALADAAINARYSLFDRGHLRNIEEQKRAQVKRLVDLVAKTRAGRSVRHFLERLQDLGPSSIPEFVSLCLDKKDKKTAEIALEALNRRMNRDRIRADSGISAKGAPRVCSLLCEGPDGQCEALLAVTEEKNFEHTLAVMAEHLPAKAAAAKEIIIFVKSAGKKHSRAELAAAVKKLPARAACLSIGSLADEELLWLSFVPRKTGKTLSWTADTGRSSLSPLMYRELRIQRLSRFRTQLLQQGEGFRLFHCLSAENKSDERLMVFVEVSSTRAEMTPEGAIGRMVAFEKTFMDAVYALRAEQIRRRNRLHWNRIVIHIRPVLGASMNQIQDYASVLAGRTLGLGIERLSIYCRILNPETGAAEEQELLFDNIVGTSFTLSSRSPVNTPMEPMDAYVAKVVRSRQRNTFYPYEVIRMLTQNTAAADELPPGEFEEFDLAQAAEGISAAKTYRCVRGRPWGQNTGNIVFGLISNILPDGRNLRRIIILSDPAGDLGSLTETECRRVNAALDLAEDLGVPAEFLPVSGGARIDMDSGTENLDWTASTLRRIISYTQAGKELNIIVAGINVGAQSYWDAEATMLMHTRGLLIMTEDAAMLLTGKKALDFSGSVSAEDNVGIGGAAKIMEPNGQAQIRVKNLKEAWMVLFRHYSLTYRQPGLVYPERMTTDDPAGRDIGVHPYRDTQGQGFAVIGDIFSAKLNPERKKPFDIRQVMGALVDQDMPRLERWGGMRDAETAVVWETRVGGYAAGLIGIESRPVARQGEVPWDGPENWPGGTLFPLSSKKIARAINAFSGRLPLLMLANLSGFDGSPESLRKLQLEYGAEIGRAVVNFRGPFIFVVIARYHGGAYVVFSKHLNANLHSVALEGAYASVIGGAPAAAVVFPSLVMKQTYQDPRVIRAEEKLKSGRGFSQKDFEEIFRRVHTEKQAGLAARFDNIHSVERAKNAGSIDAIISVKELRPYVIKKIEEWMAGGGMQGSQ
ncbi:MAG: ATP-grasp domain-containing protein [Spirochaetales bacterium]|jgi:acetyl/propionyl-CoA carboxylase alpha subunit/acetyl-CoA carboxylase carboxyltransferase component|nr:ATP-grasp domain-containing protein [Spirochaetales bacterium]